MKSPIIDCTMYGPIIKSAIGIATMMKAISLNIGIVANALRPRSPRNTSVLILSGGPKGKSTKLRKT